MRHSYPKKKKSFIIYLKFKFSYTAYIWQPELGSKADLGLPLSNVTDHVTMAVSASDFCRMDFQAPMQAGPGSGGQQEGKSQCFWTHFRQRLPFLQGPSFCFPWIQSYQGTCPDFYNLDQFVQELL